MKFNVNNYVRVKLTDHGKKILNDRFIPFYSDPLPKEDDEGWSKWQLWDLMSQFGEHISAGAEPCFETEIDILVDE